MLKAKEASQKLLSKPTCSGSVGDHEETGSCVSNDYENLSSNIQGSFDEPVANMSSNDSNDNNIYEKCKDTTERLSLKEQNTSELISNRHFAYSETEKFAHEFLPCVGLSSTQPKSNYSSFRAKPPPKPPRCDKSLFHSNEVTFLNSSDVKDGQVIIERSPKVSIKYLNFSIKYKELLFDFLFNMFLPMPHLFFNMF